MARAKDVGRPLEHYGLMTLYCSYYERSRTQLSLDKDTPIPRPVTLGDGKIVAIPRSAASIIATNGAA